MKKSPTNEPSKGYFEFVDELVKYGALVNQGESEVLARVHRNGLELGWYTVIDICATRLAHKKKFALNG